MQADLVTTRETMIVLRSREKIRRRKRIVLEYERLENEKNEIFDSPRRAIINCYDKPQFATWPSLVACVVRTLVAAFLPFSNRQNVVGVPLVRDVDLERAPAPFRASDTCCIGIV